MEIELVIHTYGHIDAVFYVLNGIAMLMGSIGGVLTTTMSFIGISYYTMLIAVNGGGNYKQYFSKIAWTILILNCLLLPKTSMTIRDHISKKWEKVDNLPYGFALPIGILEQFGYLITKGFEQAFTSPGNMNYSNYGMIFGARLVQDARNWRIKTPEFNWNMDNFLRRCVIRDAMLGHYSIDQLMTSGNVWGLVSAKLGTLRKAEMRRGNTRQLVSCREAANDYILPAFATEIIKLKEQKKSSDISYASNSERYLPRADGANVDALSNLLLANIRLAFGLQLGINQSAEESIRQQMMMNSLANISDNYGYARASAGQESSWRLAGELASTYIPILLTVMKCLIYASFLFMVPMMLIGGGGAKYLKYLSVVTSLQLWPALNTILNMFMDLYSSKSLGVIANSIVSFTTYSEVGNYVDKIVAVAAGLQMSIPFLSFAIVQGGVGGFIHLASNITGASQSAATSAANEVTSGNKSLDNVSIGNMQMAMQSGFKTDMNQSYASGTSSYQHMDGTMEKVLGSGETIFQSGTGMTVSGGNTKFNIREAASNQLTESLSNAQSLMDSDQQSYSQAKQNTFDQTASYVASLAKRESSGETFDYSKAGEHGSSLQQAVNQVHNLHKQHGYNYDKASSTALRASIGAGTPSLFGVGASGSADWSADARDSSNSSVGTSDQLNRENNSRIDYNNVVKAASSEQFAQSNNLDNSYSDDIRQSYHKQQSLEGQMSRRAEQVESYSKALSQMQSKDASYEQDMYHQLEHNVAREYGVSSKDAHQMIERGDPRVNVVRAQMVSNELADYDVAIAVGQERTGKNHRAKSLAEFNEQHQGKIDRNYPSALAQAVPELTGTGMGQRNNNHDQTEKVLNNRGTGSSNNAASSENINTEANNSGFINRGVKEQVNNLMSQSEQTVNRQSKHNLNSEQQLEQIADYAESGRTKKAKKAIKRELPQTDFDAGLARNMQERKKTEGPKQVATQLDYFP